MIVTAIDREFLPGLKALYNSMQVHSPDTPLTCMTYGDDEFADEVRGLGINVLHNITIDGYLPPGEGTDEGCHPMYARLLVPLLFNECVWLDADQVVQADLQELLDLEFEEPVAAVPAPYNTARSVRGMEAPGTAAIMSGLMVFNVPMWRRKELTQACLRIMQTPGVTFRFVVQSVLNLALEGEFYRLGKEWQGFANRTTTRPDDYKVLHWHGRDLKPWTHPEMPNADTWRKYA